MSTCGCGGHGAGRGAGRQGHGHGGCGGRGGCGGHGHGYRHQHGVADLAVEREGSPRPSDAQQNLGLAAVGKPGKSGGCGCGKH